MLAWLWRSVQPAPTPSPANSGATATVLNGKENLFAAGEWCVPPIGETPEERQERIEGGRMTLEEARRARLEWRAQVRSGRHPRLVRAVKRLEAAQSAATTFRAVTLEFVEKRGGTWGADYRRNFMGFMERDAFPDLGDQPIAALIPLHLLAVLERVEARGAVTAAHKGRSFLSSVFRYAVQTLKVPIDPMPSLRGSLGKMNSRTITGWLVTRSALSCEPSGRVAAPARDGNCRRVAVVDDAAHDRATRRLVA